MMENFHDQYKEELINNILQASSQEEVKRFIAVSIKVLEQSGANENFINEFVDLTSHQLLRFCPMNKNAQQWSNIATAKVVLYRWKQGSPDTTSNSMRNV